MKKYILLIIGIAPFVPTLSLYASSAKTQVKHTNLVEFSYKEYDLQDLVNKFLKMRDANILYTPTTAVTAKITFDAGKRISFEQAWALVLRFVEQAGFSLVQETAQSYKLVTQAEVGSSSMPVFINTVWQMLPDNEERVRYVYYFSNINITNQAQQGEIMAILKMMIPAQGFDQAVIIEPLMNGIIFTTKASLIKSAMYVLSEFDQAGEQESVQVLALEYTQASQVAQLLTGLISGQEQPAQGQAAKPAIRKGSGKSAQYFAPTTKVVSLTGQGGDAAGMNARMQASLNKLIVLGKEKDVKQVIEFIKKHIDVPLDKGKSLFHVLDLQWISAQSFVAVIKGLVQNTSQSGQSKSSLPSEIGFDQNLKIVVEASKQVASGSGVNGQPQQAGNRVLIACTERDWLRIQDVAKQIDVPQKQVIIEALILDLSMTLSRSISSQLRTKGLVASIFPKYMRAQAAMTINHVLNPNVITGPSNLLPSSGTSVPANTTLEGDLVNILTGLGNSGSAASGSTIATIGERNGNGVWAFFQLLSQHKHTKVVSRPFTIAQNGQEATINTTEYRYVPAKLTSSTTNAVANFDRKGAPTKITFKPLISDNKTITLELDVQINAWQPNQGSQVSTSTVGRQIKNKLILKHGEVAALGGSTKNFAKISKQGIPLLEYIPLVNLFTGSKTFASDESVLLILVRATEMVVDPRLQGNMGSVTARLADVARYEIEVAEETVAVDKDPITRWMFDFKEEQASTPLSASYTVSMPKHTQETSHQAKADKEEIKKSAPDEADSIQIANLRSMLSKMDKSPLVTS